MSDWYYRKQRDRIDRRLAQHLQSEPEVETNPLLLEAKSQLEAYFKGELEVFDLPIRLCGSDFQKMVWKRLSDIPFGKVITYKQMAIELGGIERIRAVASANGANAMSIILPCHRVVGSDGAMIGYAGGVEIKKKLLVLERGGYGDLFSDVL